MFCCHTKSALLGGVCDHVRERREFEIRRLFKSFGLNKKKESVLSKNGEWI